MDALDSLLKGNYSDLRETSEFVNAIKKKDPIAKSFVE